jgi:hypothetical protein
VLDDLRISRAPESLAQLDMLSRVTEVL